MKLSTFWDRFFNIKIDGVLLFKKDATIRRYRTNGTKVDIAASDLTSYSTDASGNVTGLAGPDGSILPLSKPSIASALGILPIAGRGTRAGDATNGVIMNSQLPAVASFYGVRLVYLNYDTAATMDIDGVKVCSSAVHKTPGNNAAAHVWSDFVKVNGTQAFSVPVAVAGITAGHYIPGCVITDFIPVPSIARTDTVGAPPLLRVASHIVPSAATTYHPSYNGTYYPGLNNLAANPGLKQATYAFGGAGGTLASLITSANACDDSGGVMQPIGAIFYYSTPVKSLTTFGDSLMQGNGSTTTYAGWPAYTAFNSYLNGAPVQVHNFGASGQKTVDTLAMLKGIVAKTKPEYAAFKAWSPNDGNTQAIYDTSWAYTLEAMEFCRQNGITPIVLTSGPAAGATWSLIKAQNARVLALPSWVKTVDVAAVVNNAASDGTIIPAYDADGTHYTDAGYSAIADLLIAEIT